MKNDNHIFAIEGEWEANLNKDLTIKSTLSLLQEVCGIESVFRKTNTIASLIQYLEMSSAASYKKFGTIIIATHGTKNSIELSNKEIISIEELGKECKGLFKNKTIHFSSCAVMQNSKTMQSFKEVSMAKELVVILNLLIF